MKTKRDIGIYCHVPFCQKKCAYCDFYSGCFYELADRYIEAIIKEASTYASACPKLSVSTVYFGGGTPSSLTADQLRRLIDGILSRFSISDDAEITLEANPATLDVDKLSILRSAGVNRLSIGVQSASDRELCGLSRIHTYEQFLDTYRMSGRYFDNISLDLMYGLPEQTEESFLATLNKIIELAPMHISLYALKIEPNTPFYRLQNELRLPDDDTVVSMYLNAVDILVQNGYHQYEISNFARQDSRSKHNLRYWEGKEYIGLGPSSHSYYDGVRYAITSDIHAYLSAIEASQHPKLKEEYRLTESDLLEEGIILPLRLTSGLDLDQLFEKFGYDLMKESGDFITRFCQAGYMKMNGSVLSFTPKGFLVSNTILSELIP